MYETTRKGPCQFVCKRVGSESLYFANILDIYCHHYMYTDMQMKVNRRCLRGLGVSNAGRTAELLQLTNKNTESYYAVLVGDNDGMATGAQVFSFGSIAVPHIHHQIVADFIPFMSRHMRCT